MASSTRAIDNKIIRVNYSDELQPQAEWLLDHLDSMRSDGVSIHANQRIQFGWSFLEFKQEGGEHVVHEPDFLTNPLTQTRPDISITLQVQASQLAFINQLRLSPTQASFQDKIIYAKECLSSSKIYGERIDPQPEKGDSGWFFGFVDGNNEPENLQAGYVYQLLSLRPILLQLLLLPPGYMVVLNGSEIETILDPNDEPVHSI